MAWKNSIKLNIAVLLFLSTHQLAESLSQYLSDNSINTNEASQPNNYVEVPQAYYIHYPEYVTKSSQRESQIPTSTDKTLLSSNYKVTLPTIKHIGAQAAKPPQVEYSNQAVYPYYYTLARAVPTTAATYTATVNPDTNYHDNVPKKYHYGYRVSNPETGAEFGHSEVNDGLSARGYYHVLLPDGRLQNVKYWAGPSGYHATITYESKY